MLKTFYPDEYVDSTYGIDFAALKKKGYQGVLFDIDNTLVPHGAPATEQAKNFFAELRRLHIGYCLISNNKEERVKPFADAVQAKYVENAWKPSKEGYEKGMQMLGCTSKDCLFVGDQLFTDVWGAKKAGMYTILVRPIDPKEEIQIVLKRRLEAIVLFFYLRSHPQYRKK